MDAFVGGLNWQQSSPLDAFVFDGWVNRIRWWCTSGSEWSEGKRSGEINPETRSILAFQGPPLERHFCVP